jgi:two-component system alkaline phosphatase synthesis response regulator PhoP
MIKALIVDDNEDLREIVRFFLERRQIAVVEASDGRDAVDKLRETRPDCVVLDLLMPIQDGFVTLEQIRNDPEFSELPVLVLSSLGREASVIRAFKLGATDFLRKPFSPEELYYRIVRILPEDKRSGLDLD